MATVNYSIPQKVKDAFNRSFAGENKSAIIARLMQEAVDERQRQKRRAAAVEALLVLRGGQQPASDDEIASARAAGRL